MAGAKSCLESFVNCFRHTPARIIMYFLSLTCAIILHFLRTAITFVIFAMVKEINSTDNTQSSEGTLCPRNHNITVETIRYGGTLEWSLDVQYHVVTSFFWTYIIAQTFGGMWAQRFGAKIIVGYGVLISAICTLSMPLSSNFSYVLVIIVQLLNGFAQGVVWPSLYTLVSWWVPIQEKSRYVSAFQGFSAGVTFLQIMAGFVIASIGWGYVFYICGSIGTFWCVVWYFLAYNKPELHPRISVDELNYILLNREEELQHSKRNVPWKSILCSLPTWAIAISSFGRAWLAAAIHVYGPLYLKSIIGLKIEMNGLMSGLISFGTFLSSIFYSFISDKLLFYNVLSTVANRKLFAGLGQVVTGLLCVLIGYLQCNLNLIFTVWISMQIVISANFIGTMVNIVDISPNYAGPVTGVVQTILMSSNILSPLVAKGFLQNGSNLDSWRGIFNTSAGVCFSCYLFYFIFASADVQKWDTRKESKKDNQELKSLNSST